MSPFIVGPPQPPPPLVLTDEMRAAVMTEQRTHCAPSTWDAFARSLRARRYPLDATPYIT